MRIDILQDHFKRAQVALEQYPDSPSVQELNDAKEMLQTLDRGRATWVDQVLQARWIADGDRASKLFFKSFKAMVSSKFIPSLVDSEGREATSWDEMASLVEAFFEKTLGGTNEGNSPAEQAVFQAQVLESILDRLTEEEKNNLNAPLSLDELEEALLALKKLKCPGPDRAPIEFFQALWNTVGSLILQVINRGILGEEFQQEFTLGLIVLLPKKKDQRFLNNKRPITLLNVIYKIGAKAMQKRLTPVLQQIISPQQYAFLSGQNIHHSLIMLGEMLSQGESSREEHVLLKMDVIKAFDCIEWPLLLACLEKSGLGGMLTRFLKAIFANASSLVLLNGRSTR